MFVEQPAYTVSVNCSCHEKLNVKNLEGSCLLFRVCKMDFLGVKMGEDTCLGGQEQAEVS